MLLIALAIAVPPLPSTLQVAAEPGRRTPAVSAPTFCDGDFTPLQDREATVSKLDRLLRLENHAAGDSSRFKPYEELVDDGNTVARFACTWPDDAAAHAWRAAYEQILVNHLGLPEDSMAGVWGYLLTRDEATVLAEQKAALAACPFQPAARGPADHRDTERARQRLVCESGNRMEKHWAGQAWFADRGQVLSPLDTVALVSRFVGGESLKVGFDADRYDGPALARWFFIREDVAALDEATYFAALEPLELTPWMEFNTVVGWYQLVADVGKTTDGMETYAANEPAMNTLLAAASTASTAWKTDMEAHRDAFALAARVESAWLGTPGVSMKGCKVPLREHLESRASALGAVDAPDFEALVHDPLANWLLTALRRCEAVEGDPVNAAGLIVLYDDAGAQRGWRTAAVHGAMLAAADLHRAGGSPVRPETLHPWSTSRVNSGAVGRIPVELDWSAVFPKGLHVHAGGVIRAVEAGSDGRLTLLFEHERWEQVVLDCVDTDKIDAIKSDGTLVYRRRCTRAGTEMKEHQEEPLLVDAAAAKTLKPGMLVAGERYAYAGQALSGGFIEQAWSDPSKDQLVLYAGIPVSGK